MNWLWEKFSRDILVNAICMLVTYLSARHNYYSRLIYSRNRLCACDSSLGQSYRENLILSVSVRQGMKNHV